ncbi:KLTH0C04048p [Lachancea thermotolerans CBS 6340]|uniref:KLTH0C04048p n=1 Tax=Lachancea thermotolerans (strain ATCC 56472 / CBS 6340 / NRRL Y-8284) TaxID=559295 RepID=C5DDV3_LACTC|nr:KLTH0C04048p [Lachancea thermotolerans CBS 6340]CAR21964.1 KLTH0C04048p [Lachancea thermotolerans CBS 6340]
MSVVSQKQENQALKVGDVQGRGSNKGSEQPGRSEKRKSEVLIAAQSLDSELQHVKNLKRISIGSMDMLIDPEMEFRVSPSPSQPAPTTDTSHDQQLYNSHSDHDSDDDLSYVNDSIDITSTEYLQESEGTGFESLGSSSNDADCGKRTLSGVRRGGLSGKTRMNNNLSAKDEESVTHNLLWVPANQHPNIKPENYLELVQDTLHTLKIEPDNEGSVEGGNDEKIVHAPAAASANLPPSNQLRSGLNSLVRRPSGLRKSFTELEDLLLQEAQDTSGGDENAELPSADKMPSVRPRIGSRSSSLKDITEELTRISNRAGFTDGDAVSLARTLSMASSYYTDEDGESVGSPEKKPEKEYASSMLTKNGLAIPARSSLRRSKFNTYRIRNTSGGSTAPSNLRSPSAEHNELDRSPIRVDQKNAQLQSPTSVNDFNEIYDHYRQSSFDSSLGAYPHEHQNAHTSNFHSIASKRPKDDTLLDSESSLHDLHKGSLNKALDDEQQASFRGHVEATNNDEKDDHKHASSQAPRKKSGWSWFGKKSSKDQESSPEHTQRVSSDFLGVSSSAKPTNVPTEKINHSRHRHYSIDDTANSSTESTTSNTVSSSQSPTKKQRKEKKFIQLFKRNRTTSTNGREKDDGPSISEKLQSSNAVKVLKTRTSSTNLRKNRLSPKKTRLSGDGRRESVKEDFGSTQDYKVVREEKEPLAKLQPSVSLTPKSRPPLTQDKPKQNNVGEDLRLNNQDKHRADSVLDSDSEPELEADEEAGPRTDAIHEGITESNTQAEADTVTAYAPEETAAASADDSFTKSQEPNAPELQAPAAGGYVLPPRKLAFSDVIKPERPNAPMKFSDSSFGFPLPPLTVSTVVMIDHRLPINVERAIYRLSHLKLGDPKRELRQQVILSNFMYAYLNLVNHSLYLQQLDEEGPTGVDAAGMDGMTASL